MRIQLIFVIILDKEVRDGELLLLREARASQRREHELVKGGIGRRLLALVEVIVWPLEGGYQGFDRFDRGTVDGIALVQEDILNVVPWVLVEQSNQVLVNTYKATLSERGLGQVSLNTHFHGYMENLHAEASRRGGLGG